MPFVSHPAGTTGYSKGDGLKIDEEFRQTGEIGMPHAAPLKLDL